MNCYWIPIGRIDLMGCFLESSVGYVTTQCNALGSTAILASACTLTCAVGYASSSTPTVTCSPSSGTFTIANPCELSTNMCTLPAITTGYVTTRCDRLGVGGEGAVAWWVGWVRSGWRRWAPGPWGLGPIVFNI